jgi:ubiquinone/menaquinone biosynthesis C-methylase UbiE
MPMFAFGPIRDHARVRDGGLALELVVRGEEEELATTPEYVLGSDRDEIARLDEQSAAIEEPTRQLLVTAGIRDGMRVLDLGSGVGHVAGLVAELVGSEGAVVGVERSAEMVSVAEARRAAAGTANVRFVEDDVRSFRDADEFDAVVGRLILFHLPEPVTVVRHHLGSLRPGGLVAMIDFDIGTARSEPPVPLVATLRGWIEAAFRAAGANPRVGARLGEILRDAGVLDVASFGIQPYLAPDDPRGPRTLGGVVRTLAPRIVSERLATEAELDLGTLEQRIADDLRRAAAVLTLPCLVGAWGRRATEPSA